MKTVDFYFDFISPYAYLASQALDRLDGLCRIEFKPILFAALLKHHDTRGPAEIDPMRRFTYRQIVWLARRDGIELRLPPAHPFNPLPLLRLALAKSSTAQVVDRIFKFVWAEGGSVENAQQWGALCDSLDLDADSPGIDSDSVRRQLRIGTDAAIEAGVFGVPTFAVDGELFWGYDSMPFLGEYLDDPGVLATEAMRRADSLPVGQARRR